MSLTSPTRPDQYWSPSPSPAWRAKRAFSPREAWKIEMDLESDRVRSKKRLCRVCPVASIRSSRLRPAVACGSAASSRTYRSAALRPPSGGLPSRVPSGALRWPNSRSWGWRSTVWPTSKPRAVAPGRLFEAQLPGGVRRRDQPNGTTKQSSCCGMNGGFGERPSRPPENGGRLAALRRGRSASRPVLPPAWLRP